MAGTDGEEGFLLLGALVMIFLVLLALSVAAPRIAMSLKREKEVESARRANQYVRGIRMYYKKFGRYPSSIEQLEKTNNQRFLRQRYVDPLTGKADWRLIHLGENQTKVKGFFGEELQGMQAGLGSAAGMASGFGGAASTATPSTFGNNTPGAGAGSGTAGGGLGGSAIAGGPGQGTGMAAGSSTGLGGGTAPAPGAGLGAGSGPSAGTGPGTAPGGAAPAGADALTAGRTGGLIIGIGSSRSGDAILNVNEQTTYETWEFLYDPRIEQLYAKGNLLGGGTAGSSGGGGLGSLNGSQSGGIGGPTPAGTGIGPGTTTPGTGPGTGTFGAPAGGGNRPPP